MARNDENGGRGAARWGAAGLLGLLFGLLLGGAVWATRSLRRQAREGGPAPLSLSRPSDEAVHAFIAAQKERAVTYPEVGVSAYGPAHAPAGYPVNRTRAKIGHGERDFDAAKAALRSWSMYALPWIDLCWPGKAPIRTGTVSAVRAKIVFLWALSATRLLYVVDEDHGGTARWGFAIGTLPGHVEQGEERFLVEWDHATGDVYFDLYAFAKGRHPLAVAGLPVTLWVQRRFARESVGAMRKAVRAGTKA
jgi:uncharacterized protein (UPF0548 family)